jgi:hypothetical protein
VTDSYCSDHKCCRLEQVGRIVVVMDSSRGSSVRVTTSANERAAYGV